MSLISDCVSELKEWQPFLLAMANNLIVINGSTLKTLGEIAPLHGVSTTQILDHWSVMLKSLNSHDLYSSHNFLKTWILYHVSIFTSLNYGAISVVEQQQEQKCTATEVLQDVSWILLKIRRIIFSDFSKFVVRFLFLNLTLRHHFPIFLHYCQFLEKQKF